MSPITQHAPPVSASTPPAEGPLPASPAKAGTAKRWLLPLGAIIVLAAIAFHFTRRHGPSEMPPPTVAVVKADRENLVQDMWLTAEFRPFLAVSVHAKVSGYLKNIWVNVGSIVKAGDKLAELEVPELADQLTKAQFAYQASLQDVKQAEADAQDADVSFQRLNNVAKDNPKLVAQQDIDNAKARRDASKGALGAAQHHVEEAQSEVSRVKTLYSYTVITAPFGGIVTKRYVDPGALVQAGTTSNTQALPIVDLAEQDLLRLVFPVPESAAPLIHNDEPVEIRVTALHDSFQGKIARFSGKVDQSTRTMHTEVDVRDPDARYKPGLYAFVRLVLHEEKNAIAIPVQAVSPGDTPTVFVLNPQGVIEQRQVTIGMETPDKAQITKGLAEGDLVIVGSRSGALPGQKAVGKITVLPKTPDLDGPPS
jgi:RND family efflux transporter MFP subunit